MKLFLDFQPKAGVEHGPTALRDAGLVDVIENLGKTFD